MTAVQFESQIENLAVTRFPFPVQNLLPALLPGLHGGRSPPAAAVQAAHAALRHPGQSQRGQALCVLRVGSAAGSHLLRRAGAGVGGRGHGPSVRHQGRGGPGDHLHRETTGPGRYRAAQGAGHYGVGAGPRDLPQRFHHLRVHRGVPVLSLCCTADSAPLNPVSLGHIRGHAVTAYWV